MPSYCHNVITGRSCSDNKSADWPVLHDGGGGGGGGNLCTFLLIVRAPKSVIFFYPSIGVYRGILWDLTSYTDKNLSTRKKGCSPISGPKFCPNLEYWQYCCVFFSGWGGGVPFVSYAYVCCGSWNSLWNRKQSLMKLERSMGANPGGGGGQGDMSPPRFWNWGT